MKIIDFTALLALALVAVSCTEAKFAPSTFVAKPTRTNDPAIKDFFQAEEGASTNSVSKIPTRGGGLLDKVVSPEFSYYVDVFFAIATFVFSAIWLRSKSLYDSSPDTYPDVLPNFNKMVLTDGFCLNDKFMGLGTLTICGIADLLLVIVSYFIYKDRFSLGSNKVIFYASAGYTLLHGAIHGFKVDQSGLIWDPNGDMAKNILGIALLAIITCFTPIGIKQIFEDAGQPNGLLVGIAAWISFVAFYAFGIKEKVYALTFINVTIYLSIFGARALVLKKDDEKRLDFWGGNSKMAGILAAAANIIIMSFEPLACKSWFGEIGGHLWFDVSLWLFMMSIMK